MIPYILPDFPEALSIGMLWKLEPKDPIVNLKYLSYSAIDAQNINRQTKIGFKID